MAVRSRRTRPGETLALVGLYRQGTTTLLPFFPATSLAFATAVHRGKSEEEALKRAMPTWEGDPYRGGGEKDDPYIRLCWKSSPFPVKPFMQQAKTVFLPGLQQREKYQG